LARLWLLSADEISVTYGEQDCHEWKKKVKKPKKQKEQKERQKKMGKKKRKRDQRHDRDSAQAEIQKTMRVGLNDEKVFDSWRDGVKERSCGCGCYCFCCFASSRTYEKKVEKTRIERRGRRKRIAATRNAPTI
jgi:hypothetical protein